MHPADDEQARGRAGAKRAVRARVLAARDALPAAERARLSTLVCARAAGLPELCDASSAMLFASFRSEVDTDALVRSFLRRGVTVALPRVRGPRLLEAVLVADPQTDLAPGRWGIPEPRDDLPVVGPERLDVVVVPGVAFSVGGERCGYGGGFYDAFLRRLTPGTPRLALAFEVQVVDDLPVEPHDVAIDAIVTETRVIRAYRAP